MSKTHLAAAGALALVLAPAAALAAPAPSVATRLDALEKALAAQQAQITQQQQTIDAQAAEIARLRAEAAQTASQAQALAQQQPAQDQIVTLQNQVAASRMSDAERPRVSMPNGRLTVTSPDGRNTIAFRALVQGDAAHYWQDSPGPDATDFRRGSVGGTGNRETLAARDLSDGAYFRRARLGVEGTFNRDWGYKIMLELAGSGTEGPARINDAWVSYTGFAPFTIQAGAFSPPANMDDGTSPEDLLFLERASASELSRTLGGADGRIGVGARFATPNWMGALTFTGRTVNDAEVFDSSANVVARLAHAFVNTDDMNFHLGASGTYVIHPADQGLTTSPRYPLRLRDRPEIRVDGTRLIDTGSIDADHAYAVGLEAAFRWQNLLIQGEHFWFGLDRRQPTTLTDPSFRGFYIQGSWVISGEPHRYNMANGSFQNPRPRLPLSSGGGTGAWEVAVRYSEMDLNYREGVALAATPADGVRGGDQRIWSFGLNWYPTVNLKFMLDYQHIDVDRLNPGAAAFGAGAATPPTGVQIGQDADVISARSQFAF